MTCIPLLPLPSIVQLQCKDVAGTSLQYDIAIIKQQGSSLANVTHLMPSGFESDKEFKTSAHGLKFQLLHNCKFAQCQMHRMVAYMPCSA